MIGKEGERNKDVLCLILLCVWLCIAVLSVVMVCNGVFGPVEVCRVCC